VELLLASLDRILDAGGSVIVIEHNLDVIRRADHVIDLGPEAGPEGGRIVAQGPPAVIAGCPESHTGAALRAAALPTD
jgi:excinuclease ABC subunit A